jgi:hypothetical protein
MKRHWVLFMAFPTIVAWIDVALWQERAVGQPSHQTFCERRAKKPAPGRLKRLAPDVVCVV